MIIIIFMTRLCYHFALGYMARESFNLLHFLPLTSPVETLSTALGSLHPVLSQCLLALGLGHALLWSCWPRGPPFPQASAPGGRNLLTKALTLLKVWHPPERRVPGTREYFSSIALETRKAEKSTFGGRSAGQQGWGSCRRGKKACHPHWCTSKGAKPQTGVRIWQSSNSAAIQQAILLSCMLGFPWASSLSTLEVRGLGRYRMHQSECREKWTYKILL